MVQEAMTPGVLNALNKNRNRSVCPSCGFPLPVYPGRYPSHCPQCGGDRVAVETPEQEPEEDSEE
jgi:uncharacterized Zn finger protein (UPF0148 family)